MTTDATPFHIGCPFHVTRRDFLAAAGITGMAAVGLGTNAIAEPASALPAGREKAKVRLIFSHVTGDRPCWPNIGYDFEGRKKELLAKLQKACPEIEFLVSSAMNGDDAKRILAEDKDIDGYVVYLLGIWTGVARVVADSGRPTIFIDDLYGGSGEFLVEYSRARRAKQKVAAVSSTDFNDVAQAVNTFAAINKLRRSTILAVIGSDSGTKTKHPITDLFGTTVNMVPGEELNEAFDKADRGEARSIADRWIKAASKVIEPSREEIERSAGMYIGMRELLKRYNAQAITINCLGLFYSNKIFAYPCLGFWQLNNDGYVGACEGDLRSTFTMLAVGALTGRPGFISDPVIDTSKNQLIYAHCVAPSKVYGPEGASNLYHIRSHSEDRKGACIRSLMPLNEIVTTLEIMAEGRKLLIHQGKTVENVDEDKACRTKLAVTVRDARTMLSEWDQWGWHRVTFFGDLRPQIDTFATLMGIDVIQEGTA